MPAEIINLRRARKAKSRREAEVQAAENRVAFGRSKAERQATEAARELEARRLDGLQLDRAANVDGDADSNADAVAGVREIAPSDDGQSQ